MSVATTIICDRCRRWFGTVSPSSNAGPDRLTAHELRASAKSSDWRVQVSGIAPKLRRTQGSLDFCPGCVAAWDVEDAAPHHSSSSTRNEGA